MKKLSRFYLVGIILLTAALSFPVLLILSTTYTDTVLLPTITPPDACAISPTACSYSTSIAPVPYPTSPPPLPIVQSQCGVTDEKYDLRAVFPTPDTASAQPVAYTRYPSPDKHYEFYKEGDFLYISGQKGITHRLVSDFPYSDIQGRVFWSPNSRYVMFTPGNNNYPILFNASNGHSYEMSSVPSAFDFRGWSPDGEHFLYGNGDGLTVSIWSAESGQIVYSTENHFSQSSWSPDGHWLAYTWNNDIPENGSALHGVTIVAADGSSQQPHLLFTPSSSNLYSSYASDTLIWSPDSRFLALKMDVRSDQNYHRPLIFNVDGSVLAEGTLPASVSHLPPLSVSDEMLLSQARWSENVNRFTDVQPLARDLFGWLAYYPDDDTVVTLADDLEKLPFYSPSNAYIGLYTVSDGFYSLHITDGAGENPAVLVEQSTDAGNPDWSPDETWVAAVWAEGKGILRRVHLTWMRPDSTARQDVTANFKDVRELRWMDGGKRLAYIAWRGAAGNSIEVVDTTTGERYTLADKLESVTNPEYDAETDTLSFWWQTSDGRFGKDAYHSEDTQLYHVVAAGEFERPRQEFWSPDGKIIAIKMLPLQYRGLFGQMLVLSYTDGRNPIILRSGMDDLGDPVWSPDSRELAFSQAANGSNLPFQLVDSDGNTLWYTWENLNGRTIEWVRC